MCIRDRVTTGTIATACSLAALESILDTSDIDCVKVKKMCIRDRVDIA